MLNDLLRQELLEFRREREWEQFHNPRNLATALSVEAAELLEPFRWASEAQALDIVQARRGEIANELADIAILLTYLTHDLGIDLNAAVASKIQANAQKYPIDKARGSNKKYTEL